MLSGRILPIFGTLLSGLLLPAAAQAQVDFSRLSIWGSSTAERIAPALNSATRDLNFSFFNGGYGATYSDSLLAVHGSAPAQLRFSASQLTGLSSAGNSAVSIPGIALWPQVKSWSGVLEGTDVKGTVSYSAAQSAWVFTKSDGSTVLAADQSYTFIPNAGTTFANGFQILNIGKNDIIRGSQTASDIIGFTTTAYNYLPQAGEQALVMGHFSHGSPTTTAETLALVKDVNDGLRSAYGDRFIDLQAYVTGSQIWKDLGITPTATDLDYQSRGLLAPSLTTDQLHLTTEASAAVVNNLIVPRLRELYKSSFGTLQASVIETQLLPVLAALAGAEYEDINRRVSADRSQLHHDWREGMSEGLRFSAFYGLSEGGDVKGDGNGFGLGLIYSTGDWRLSGQIHRDSYDSDAAGATSEIKRTGLSLGLARSFGDLHLSARLGATSGDFTSQSADKTMKGKGDLDSRYIEVEIAHSIDQGDWKMMPAAWLRKQEVKLSKLSYEKAGVATGTLRDQSSDATIGGIGFELAYQGWENTTAEFIPALRISYETNISNSVDPFSAAGLSTMSQPKTGEIFDNSLLIEPSVSFGTPGLGQTLVSGWYSSANKGYGLGLRWNAKF